MTEILLKVLSVNLNKYNYIIMLTTYPKPDNAWHPNVIDIYMSSHQHMTIDLSRNRHARHLCQMALIYLDSDISFYNIGYFLVPLYPVTIQ